ncbi:MAG TPA: hypothetical protein VK861_05050 [Bacteroidales bacterium]|nr:hypothetical protein [Bacteroidales bacterium]
MALPNRVQYFSAAPNPEIGREQQRHREEELRKLEQSRQDFKRKNAARNNKMRMSATLTIFFMAASLFVTIYRSGMIYDMQNEYVQMQTETRMTERSNEALKAKLIKASSIGDIAEKSIELELVSVDRESFIEVDLTKDNFAEIESVTAEPKFTDKIFSMLNLNISN